MHIDFKNFTDINLGNLDEKIMFLKIKANLLSSIILGKNWFKNSSCREAHSWMQSSASSWSGSSNGFPRIQLNLSSDFVLARFSSAEMIERCSWVLGFVQTISILIWLSPSSENFKGSFRIQGISESEALPYLGHTFNHFLCASLNENDEQISMKK